MGQPARKIERRKSDPARGRATAKKRLAAVSKRRPGRSPLAALFPYLIGGAVLLAAVLFLNSSLKALVAQGSVEINDAKSSYIAAKEANEVLRIRKADLESPKRIEQEALGKLKMVRPVEVSYITLEPSKKAGSDKALAMAE